MYNYIKQHRKNWGLTQKELGFLIGFNNNVRISQLERGHKNPNFPESIMFELLFEKSSSRLFPDMYHHLTNTLLCRLKLLDDHYSEIKRTYETDRIRKRISEISANLEEINGQRI